MAVEPSTAEYQGNDITIVSRDPLIGHLELATNDDDTIDLRLDRESATNLISALVQFLEQGEGAAAYRKQS